MSNSSYCTVQDVQDRVSLTGMLNMVDDDNNNVLSGTETTIVQAMIDQTSIEIDFALCKWVITPVVTSNATAALFLQRLNVDLAVERLAARKGSEITDEIKASAELARSMLAKVAGGPSVARVPGLIYYEDTQTYYARFMGLPVVLNPWNKHRRCH